jgi:O-antigen/teichoic acid export membrane protein
MVFLSLIAVWLLIPEIIHLIFSGKYDNSMQYFIFLAIGWSLRQLTQLQSSAIFGLGKIQYNAYICLITLIFNILLITIFLHFFGLMGAAYSSVFGGLVFLLTSRYFYHKAQNEM